MNPPQHRARIVPSLAWVTWVSLAALSLLGGCGRKAKPSVGTPQRGTVVRLVAPSTGLGLQICDPEGAACARAALGSAVPAGSLLRSGAHSTAQISLTDGSGLALDHDTEFQLSRASRPARLSRGALVLDVANKLHPKTRCDVNEGSVELESGKIALRAGSDFAILDVIRGSARFAGGGGNAVAVGAGEEARLYRGSEPYISSGAPLAEAVRFTDGLEAPGGAEEASRGLGELTARRPGSGEELRGAVSLAAHRVQVRIAGAMARTEIDRKNLEIDKVNLEIKDKDEQILKQREHIAAAETCSACTADHKICDQLPE